MQVKPPAERARCLYGPLSRYSMPHKVYHGKTGVIYNVAKSAVGIIIYKKVKHRYIEKRINIRIEHISPSRSREGFLKRVKENAEKKKQAKSSSEANQQKQQPDTPQKKHTETKTDNQPETVAPVAYETTI